MSEHMIILYEASAERCKSRCDLWFMLRGVAVVSGVMLAIPTALSGAGAILAGIIIMTTLAVIVTFRREKHWHTRWVTIMEDCYELRARMVVKDAPGSALPMTLAEARAEVAKGPVITSGHDGMKERGE